MNYFFISFLILLTVQPANGAKAGEMKMSDETAMKHDLKPESNIPLKGREIKAKIGETALHAYVSAPPGNGSVPAVIMIHEWWGLNKNIKEAADRLAAEGYFVMAVDLYNGKVATDMGLARRLASAVKPDKAMKTLQASYAWIKKNPATSSTKLGTIGWCFGGGYALQAGLELPQVDAVAIYYGVLEKDPKVLSRLKGPVLGIFANKDQWINREMVNDFEKGLQEARILYNLNRYNADHAFANPSNPGYDAEATSDSWAKTIAFFNKNLKGQS